jgi:hypothetical protein
MVEAEVAAINVSSPAFENGGSIPKDCTADGENVSPRIGWQHVPGAAKSLALVCEDPDAPRGTFVHWVIYNIEPSKDSLARGIPPSDVLDGDVRQGRNDFGKIGYGGPAPPKGATHRYYFRVYALDIELNGLESGGTRQEFFDAAEGHIVAEGELMGTYGR